MIFSQKFIDKKGIGERIRLVREILCMTQVEFSEFLSGDFMKVTASGIQHIENGYIPSIEFFNQIELKFEIKIIIWLMTGHLPHKLNKPDLSKLPTIEMTPEKLENFMIQSEVMAQNLSMSIKKAVATTNSNHHEKINFPQKKSPKV